MEDLLPDSWCALRTDRIVMSGNADARWLAEWNGA